VCVRKQMPCFVLHAMLNQQVPISYVCCCTAVPEKPIVSIKELSPNMIILAAEPPAANGGREVIGYRVEYGHKIMDFAVGLYTNMWISFLYSVNVLNTAQLCIIKFLTEHYRILRAIQFLS
jgi:hypothetical protein